MYLAREYNSNGEAVFYLRETVEDENGQLVSRELFKLGPDPEEFVEYIDERIFYISPQVEDALSDLNVRYDYEELEEIFWPFIDPEIRETLDNFGGIRGRSAGKRRRRHREMPRREFDRTHTFDRRRLYYLKFVQINMGDAVERPLPIYEILTGKCRDEIENRITFMEFDIRPWEMRGYLYAIFNIAEGFAPKLTRFVPDVQDPDLIDRFFLEELCRLNSDTQWLGDEACEKTAGMLHPYLRKYLFMYFDTYFSNRGYWKPGGRPSGTEGEWHPPAPSGQDDHLKAIRLSAEEFRKMSVDEFTSYFRKKAMELHPDKGGDHDTFVAFINAYQMLLMRKKW